MNDRLRRLLLVVPAARARPGIQLDELARTLACEPAELRKDIDLLACVGAPPFLPDDLIDIELRDDRVYVSLPQSFDRPTRLTATEAAALVAATRALAPDDPLVASAIGKLTKGVAPEQKALYEALLARFGAAAPDETDALVTTLREASERRDEIEILYFARSELSPRARVVRPRALAAADGVRYLAARNDRDEERLYRLDRIAHAKPTGRGFAALPEIDLNAALARVAGLDANEELPRATLRFSRGVAEAARARHPHARPVEGGAVEAAVSFATLPWLISYTLSWGGAATLVEPPQARRALREAALRALAAACEPASH